MYILFDIGATKMRVARSITGAYFDARSIKIIPTPQSYTKGIAALQNLARELAQGKKIKAVAGGIAGSLDARKTSIFHAPNLPDWSKKPFKKSISKVLGTKNIFLENDTALVGLGEATKGSGRGSKIVAYITISTGVNGVRIIDGAIDQSARGFEIGYQIMGNKPEYSLESFVGAAALRQRYGKSAKEIKNPHVWEKIHTFLAYGIYNTMLYWSPDVLVLGGGQINAGDISFDRILKKLSSIHPRPFPTLPPIKKACLGDHGGLWGALQLLK